LSLSWCESLLKSSSLPDPLPRLLPPVPYPSRVSTVFGRAVFGFSLPSPPRPSVWRSITSALKKIACFRMPCLHAVYLRTPSVAGLSLPLVSPHTPPPVYLRSISEIPDQPMKGHQEREILKTFGSPRPLSSSSEYEWRRLCGHRC